MNVTVASNGFRGQTLELRATALQATGNRLAPGGVVRKFVKTVIPKDDRYITARTLPLPTPSSRAFRFRIVVALSGGQPLDFDDTRVLSHRVTKVRIVRSGPGSVTDSITGTVCDGAACRFPYSAGAHVSLHAIPNSGEHFQHWGARCSGAEPTCRFRVGATSVQVVAVFGGSVAPAAAIVSRFDRRGFTPYRQRDRTYVGYGHQLTDANVHSGTLTIGGKPVAWGSRHPLTDDQVKQLLKEDLNRSFAQVRGLVKTDLTDNQLQALADFVYNEGIDAFRASTLLKMINAGQLDEVPAEFRRWRLSQGKILPKLIRRRAAEIALWNEK